MMEFFDILIMCFYLTANGLCASDEAREPFPPCEFIRRGRDCSDCSVYREYMTELFLYSEYVYEIKSS